MELDIEMWGRGGDDTESHTCGGGGNIHIYSEVRGGDGEREEVKENEDAERHPLGV